VRLFISENDKTDKPFELGDVKAKATCFLVEFVLLLLQMQKPIPMKDDKDGLA